jgi:amidase
MNGPLGLEMFAFGSATASWLPLMLAPVGQTPDGLRLGMRIVRPETADPSTTRMAGELTRPVGGFVPPPGC